VRPDQREFARLRANPEICCDFTLDGEVYVPVATVVNVSPAGVQLRVNIPVPVGSVLRAYLENPARGLVCSRMVRVVYCILETSGTYLLGGFFHQGISLSDLAALTEPEPT
jgi:hypothetical protein